ncbi:ComEA family DNA-binding protein [Oscillatoria sp. FACHB-1406]|uniref:ComEA family DNA-binding protein n=1 Tax=Oscillatoria sp. FACHB-1406 TaxID=2692846 RepID=UPI0016860A0E|nr:ComEA family DNA-binding protein [Oscillatoria sp. FACHB-1406]MBD2577447.1 ComEA family DNA-binding protein [Oscillatoria sp. FACHB-1406]
MVDWRSSAGKLQALNPRHRAIRARLLRDPYARLQTLEEVAIAASLGLKIDVNRASIDDWLRLPGISIHQARSLVELVGMGVQLLSIEDIAAATSIPRARLQPLEPLLSFYYYDPESLVLPQRVNPNTATPEQLARIPLLDAVTINDLILDRTTCGAYRNLADLQRRLNLSSTLTAQLMHYFQFN